MFETKIVTLPLANIVSPPALQYGRMRPPERTTARRGATLKRGPETLRSQLLRTLRRAILSGTLPPHAHLPSTRALAQRLGVSRNTVLAAYEALASEGLVVGRAGSGTRVAD